MFFILCILDKRPRSHYNDVIIYDVINIMHIFSLFELTLRCSIPVQNFIVIDPLTTKIRGDATSLIKSTVRLGFKELISMKETQPCIKDLIVP